MAKPVNRRDFFKVSGTLFVALGGAALLKETVQAQDRAAEQSARLAELSLLQSGQHALDPATYRTVDTYLRSA